MAQVLRHLLHLLLLILLVFFSDLVLLMATAATISSGVARPSPAAPARLQCPSKCGEVEIPYPFGLSDNCSLHSGFTITCNHSSSPPRPYLRAGGSNVEVMSISLNMSELRVVSPQAYTCHGSANKSIALSLQPPFEISTLRNMFTAVGCNTLALLQGGGSHFTGCATACESLISSANDGQACTGRGCCQAAISGSNLTTIKVIWNDTPDNEVWRFSPCSYAFVAEEDWYSFRERDLVGVGEKNFRSRDNGDTVSIPYVGQKNPLSRDGGRGLPLVLDWEINGLCNDSSPAPACVSAHSRTSCFGGSSYRCYCSAGYQGNPYVTDGCTNVNECATNRCDTATTICQDSDGGFECKCKLWYRRDASSHTRCQRIFTTPTIATIIATIALPLLTYLAVREWKKQKLRKTFNKNGGDLLKDVHINIFTEAELKKITNGYKTIIGEGAFGKVYKGTIDGTTQVAVKCSFERSKVHCHVDFRNEIIFQFRINHPNVVRLIGCCLEADVPKLVFEFIPNGSLYNLLHGARHQALSLPTRLNIAIGSAEALRYMHLQGGDNNHVHGDFKSGNILLDNDLTPKVSDFGSSKLVSIVSGYAKWCVSGDMNYIDPTYINTGRFTEKSDVYSFGVVLLELITRKTAKYDGSNSLPINFVKLCKEKGNERTMYDQDILMSDESQAHHYMECLDMVGTLAVKCLKEDVDKRPNMAQVLEELIKVKNYLAACGSEAPAHIDAD